MKKSRITSTVAFLCGAVFLSACSPRAPHSKTGSPPELKRCASNCVILQDKCLVQHQKIREQCVAHAKQQAKQNWRSYVTARIKAHEKIDRHENDFLNLSDCDQSPSCKADYASCNALCRSK